MSEREYTSEECAVMVEIDFKREHKDLVLEIYKEAHNGRTENLEARTPKTIAKACTLFSMLAAEQEKTAKLLIEHTKQLTNQTDVLITESKNLTKYTIRLFKLTWAVVGLTVVLAFLGFVDWYDKHQEWIKSLFAGCQ